MKLRTLIVVICTVLFVLMTAFFSLSTKILIGSRFSEQESIHLSSVRYFANIAIEGKKFLLRSYAEQIVKNASLAQALIMSDTKDGQQTIRATISQIQHETRCDIADVLLPTTGHSVLTSFAEKDRALIATVIGGKFRTRLERIQNEPALLAYSPVHLNKDVMGIMVLGYFLNRDIAQAISQATNTTVYFSNTDPPKDRQSLVIQVEETPANLIIEKDMVSRVNRQAILLILVAGILSLFLVATLIDFFLNRFFVRSFSEVLGKFKEAATGLKAKTIRIIKGKDYAVDEVSQLSHTGETLTESLQGFQDHIRKTASIEAMGKKAEQVAHDLKGPVTALADTLAVPDLGALTHEMVVLVHALVARIQGTVHDLALQSQSVASSESINDDVIDDEPVLSKEAISPLELLPSLRAIVAEKSVYHKARTGITLLVEESQVTAPVFVEVQRIDFKRVIANLVDNAVQAISGTGVVGIKITDASGQVAVEIHDNGKGIPKAKLASIGKRNFSHGKTGGKGVALWYAKAAVAHCGGKLTITSVENEGTTVSIALPKKAPPSWYTDKIKLSDGMQVVVLDDDPIIHRLWDDRMKDIPTHAKNIVHCSTAEEFVLWYTKKRNRSQPLLLLCDYELRGEKWNGLEVIAELSLAKDSILVTGHFEREEVREACSRMGVKLIDKVSIRVIPIVTGNEKTAPQNEGGA